MKILIVISILFLSTININAQEKSDKELKKWMKENNIVFNSPFTPDGFTRFLDCDNVFAFKKEIGDTLIIYSRGGSIAENIDELNESVKDPIWNSLRYPKYSQNNGTIVIQIMRKRVFLINKDTLYLLDVYDDLKAAEHLKLTKKLIEKNITISEFEKLALENSTKDYGFVPKFKAIYFTGIFNKSEHYQFSKDKNFREESVYLINAWNDDEKEYFEINLETNTAGKFIISEDFDFINTEKCN